jgi:ABC-2 type transport system ATP-binding protein
MYETVVVQGLVKHYGDGGRVGPISLTVRRQEVYGLVGPNGSGKTTTIRAILGLLKPSSGTVTVMGYNPFKDTKKVNLLVGYSPEIPVYPSFYSARQLLTITCRLKGLSRQDTKREVDRLLDLIGLVNHADRKIGNFSKGMVQRLSIGLAMVGDPEILVLDEPMLGVDPVGRVQIRDILGGLKKEGKTIIFSSHELYEVERLADTVGMVYMGRTVLEKAVAELLSNRDGLRVVAELKKPPHPETLEKLRTLKGVEHVSAEAQHVTVLMNGYDARDEVAKILANSDYGLVGLKTLNPTLEEVFIKVVENALR